MEWLGRESGPSRWETGDQPTEPWHGQISWVVWHLYMLLLFWSAAVCYDSGFLEVTELRRMEEGNTYDPRWHVPPFGCGSEGERFHVIACKINYTNEECADMHLILGKVRGSPAEVDQLRAERCSNRRTPSRHFEDQLRVNYYFCINLLLSLSHI